MILDYLVLDTIPDAGLLDGILDLHKAIFGASDDLADKMKEKPNLLIHLALDGEKVAGYKIGYELNPQKFYSWLGGVDVAYRNHGIASTLMEKQHQEVVKRGYQVVQTKTMNRWRNMLILNIKSGFDVIETYTDEKGRHKIILEKNLID